jgi:hypothetical protein
MWRKEFVMARKNNNAGLAQYAISKEAFAKLTQTAKMTQIRGLLTLLKASEDPDENKKIRRQLRRRGWYISKKGREVKGDNKAKAVKTDAPTAETPTPEATPTA